MENDKWKIVFSSCPSQSPFFLEAMKGVEPLSSGLQDRRSVIQLSYIAVMSRESRVVSLESALVALTLDSRLATPD